MIVTDSARQAARDAHCKQAARLRVCFKFLHPRFQVTFQRYQGAKKRRAQDYVVRRDVLDIPFKLVYGSIFENRIGSLDVHLLFSSAFLYHGLSRKGINCLACFHVYHFIYSSSTAEVICFTNRSKHPEIKGPIASFGDTVLNIASNLKLLDDVFRVHFAADN